MSQNLQVSNDGSSGQTFDIVWGFRTTYLESGHGWLTDGWVAVDGKPVWLEWRRDQAEALQAAKEWAQTLAGQIRESGHDITIRSDMSGKYPGVITPPQDEPTYIRREQVAAFPTDIQRVLEHDT